ncbi:MAG: sigma 54-interacting transcriptional regulator [Planctomycetota bacterium]
MEWRALEEHFRAATTQAPAPFGDDAIEWDYSRYSRALGLTGQPGLDDLQHTGSAVLALPGRRWEPAARKYEGWAGQQDWSLVRLSARPTVMVPDPVVHGLGVALAGRDGLIFARSGRQGPPALGARPRPAGMSIPLTPGERWLIATAHVRRRLRNEMAVRGLVLFIEEAHRLTPAALALLAHVIRAHRAWQARMLARDAKAYVVFVTTPDHKAEMLAMLERFDIQGPPPVRRDRIRKDAPSVPQPVLTVEQEHLLSALAAAPLALTESDIATLFGSSAAAAARDLVERDVLQVRVEAGERCFVPRVAHLDDLSDPPPRVLQALHDHYRKRLKRGHQHLRFAAAAIAARLGQPLRAAAHIHRASPADTATLPFDTYQELRRTLTSVKNRLHASHLGTWIAMHAHQRQYDRAKGLATDLTQTDIRTAREFYRVLVQILCMGRTHTDQAIPEDFWPGLKSKTLDASLVDAVCIFSELFARLRMMKPAEILQRYEFAEECLRQARSRFEAGTAHPGLAQLIELLHYRVELVMRSQIRTGPLRSKHSRWTDLRGLPFVRPYVGGTVAYARIIDFTRDVDRGSDDRSLPLELIRTTGNPCDEHIQLGGWSTGLFARGRGLLIRQLVDDLVVLLMPGSSLLLRHNLGRTLQKMAGDRAWLMSANNLVLGRLAKDRDHSERAHDAVSVARALLGSGDFAGAADSLRRAWVRDVQTPVYLTLLIQTEIQLARKTLRWDGLNAAKALVEQAQAKLPQRFLAHLQAFLRGSEFLCAGRLTEAEESFREARNSLGQFVPNAFGALQQPAVRSAAMTLRIGRAVERSCSSAKRPKCSDLFSCLEYVLSHPPAVALSARDMAQDLDYIFVLLEAWAKRTTRSDFESPIGVALFLRRTAEGALRSASDDCASALARVAPAFFRLLHSSLQQRLGSLLPSTPSTRAVGSALGLVENLWGDRDRALRARRSYELGFVSGQSRQRQARKHERVWEEDAATYGSVVHRLGLAWAEAEGAQPVLGYGYLGPSASSPSKVTIPVSFRWQKAHVCSVVLPSCRRTHDDQQETPEAQSAPTSTKYSSGPRGGATSNGFLGSSKEAQEVRAMIQVAAGCAYPVLVLGETGVGKEIVAGSIHAMSSRGQKTLVVADCASTADSILESELFGHVKGSFTGADSDHAGHFQRADGSTLFLDEVDTMSPRMQAALLRVLESGDYRPVGGAAHLTSDFRLISAAMPRLTNLVRANQFREDLFYRISTLQIAIPPLRERLGDANEIARIYAKGLGCVLQREALREVENYSWPGNVRQLMHCVQVASLSAVHGQIGLRAMATAIDAYRSGQGQKSPMPRGTDATATAWSRAASELATMPFFGAWEFARAAQVSRRSAQRHLARLLKQGRITRLGAGRATRYVSRRGDRGRNA